MSYVRKLTFNLRVRGLSEPEIADVLDDVRAHGAATGTAAEATFGTAEEYAKLQERRPRFRRPGIAPASHGGHSGMCPGWVPDRLLSACAELPRLR